MAIADMAAAIQQAPKPGIEHSLTRLNKVVLSEEKLEAVLELVVSLTARTLQSAIGVGVTLLQSGRFETAAYSNEIARRVDQWQYATQQGPCLSAIKDGKTYSVPDLRTDERWPDFAKMAPNEGVDSVLSVPFVPMGEPIGALNIYSDEPGAFGPDELETASLFAEQAAIVIANSIAHTTATALNGHLKEALESRSLIGQATGILMARENCAPDEAFAILRNVSQRSNRKLRDVAEGIVRSVTNPSH